METENEGTKLSWCQREIRINLLREKETQSVEDAAEEDLLAYVVL